MEDWDLSVDSGFRERPYTVSWCDENGEPLITVNMTDRTVEVHGDLEKAGHAFWEVVRALAPEYFKEK